MILLLLALGAAALVLAGPKGSGPTLGPIMSAGFTMPPPGPPGAYETSRRVSTMGGDVGTTLVHVATLDGGYVPDGKWRTRIRIWAHPTPNTKPGVPVVTWNLSNQPLQVVDGQELLFPSAAAFVTFPADDGGLELHVRLPNALRLTDVETLWTFEKR